MGKRRRNPRMEIPGALGPDNFRFCYEHDELVKPVKLFGQGFKFECKQGCYLDKHKTNLKLKDVPKTKKTMYVAPKRNMR